MPAKKRKTKSKKTTGKKLIKGRYGVKVTYKVDGDMPLVMHATDRMIHDQVSKKLPKLRKKTPDSGTYLGKKPMVRELFYDLVPLTKTEASKVASVVNGLGAKAELKQAFEYVD